jgi:translocator protein
VKLERRDWISLALALLIPQLAGGLGAVATASSVPTWYRTIRKPSWNPPSWVFGPVWTMLYLLMGFASWLVWRRSREERRTDSPLAPPEDPEEREALVLYGAQLAFNSLWSVIFFGLRSIGGALAEIVLLWGLILATVLRFYRLRPAAGLLLLPYLAWSSFATVLNAAIWRLNR